MLCAIFGELVVPKDPLASDPINDLLAPSADNWFGTDKLGRDVFSRVIIGARDILIVAPLATILATVLGHGARARDGLLPRVRRRRAEPDHRGVPGAAR